MEKKMMADKQKIQRSLQGFTLIEMMVSIVVLSVVAMSSFLLVTAVNQSNESSRNESKAVDLLQKSLEEVRFIAISNFDTLDQCQFPPAPNSCGFDDLSVDARFNGFIRTLNVTQANGPELKSVEVTVSWDPFGSQNVTPQGIRSLSSRTFLARPPDPLPGNIAGQVRSTATGNPLVPNADITIDHSTAASLTTTSTSTAINAKGHNFTYADPNSGNYALATGSWGITVTAPGFQNYTHPNRVNVLTASETEVFLDMTPLPQDATVTLNVVDRYTGQRVPSFANGAELVMMQNGQVFQNNTIANQASHTFTVPFQNTNTQYVTVATSVAFWAGYAFQVNYGGAPSCVNKYQSLGVSSAIYDLQSQTLMCGNSYFGTAGTDAVQINPGDQLQIDLPVEPIPTVTVSGVVVDALNNPIANATVSAQWHTAKKWINQATSKSDGSFTIDLPVAQELFGPNQFMRLQAGANVKTAVCCQQQRLLWQLSPWVNVGPLPGFSGTVKLVIPNNSLQCGDVTGRIRDALTNSPVNNARVRIMNQGSEMTKNNGKYNFICQGGNQGFRVSAASYPVTVNEPGYYMYGNTLFYTPKPNVDVLANTTAQYDAKLWPKGYGQIDVLVLDKVSNLPLQGMEVEITKYGNSPSPQNVSTQITNTNGFTSFNSYIESWPPVGLVANNQNNYFNVFNGEHTLIVRDLNGLYPDSTPIIVTLDRGTQLSYTVYMQLPGGM